jgi:hypothetical protein
MTRASRRRLKSPICRPWLRPPRPSAHSTGHSQPEPGHHRPSTVGTGRDERDPPLGDYFPKKLEAFWPATARAKSDCAPSAGPGNCQCRALPFGTGFIELSPYLRTLRSHSVPMRNRVYTFLNHGCIRDDPALWVIEALSDGGHFVQFSCQTTHIGSKPD